jgi:glycosyltransferase involved in cell wall biosynthesis
LQKKLDTSTLETSFTDMSVQPKTTTMSNRQMDDSYVLKPFSICLSMIVKNESRIIRRMLESVMPYIDAYCICDTGSDDNTVDVIQETFALTHVAGKVVTKHRFLNFEETRNAALNEAKNLFTTHILLMDADMLFEVSESLKGNKAKFDAYLMELAEQKDPSRRDYAAYSFCQGTSSRSFFYENLRLVPNSFRTVSFVLKRSLEEVKYMGVTHEYVNLPSAVPKLFVSRQDIYINDVGDGGCKSDKHDRDIRLLRQGIEEITARIPDVSIRRGDGLYVRYHFYLANAHFCAGGRENHEKAIEFYRKRIELGGWSEEVWYSYHRIGLIYRMFGNIESATTAWLEAYKINPDRAENILEIVNHYRCKSTADAPLAHLFYQNYKLTNKSTPESRALHLFNEESVYTYQLDYEYTVYAFYLPQNGGLGGGLVSAQKQRKWLAHAFTNVFNHDKDASRLQNTLTNIRFYAKRGDFTIGNMFLKGCEPVASRHMIPLTQHELRLIESKQHELRARYNDLNIKLVNSSTCIIGNPHKFVEDATSFFWAVTRFVTYVYDIQTNKYLCCENRVITVNMFRKFDAQTMSPIDDDSSCWILENVTPNGFFVGIEDVRFVFSPDGFLHFIGTTQHPIRRNMGISYVRVPFDQFVANPPEATQVLDEFEGAENIRTSGSPFDAPRLKFLRCAWWSPGETPGCEKNWVFIPPGTGLTPREKSNILMIYNWAPTVRVCLLNPTNDTLEPIREIANIPSIFGQYRGSTNGIHVQKQKEIWFLIHMVSPSPEPRHYYHGFVVFDEAMTQLLGYSTLFKISDSDIEYCIGMELFGPDFVLTYSTWDRTTDTVRIPYSRVKAELNLCGSAATAKNKHDCD